VYRHFDSEKLAKLIVFFRSLIEYFKLQTIEDLLMVAAALETNAMELRQKAARLAEEKINPSPSPLDPAE